MQVVVAHAGRQHSDQAALALYRTGLLAGYWTGIPCLKSHGRFVPRFVWNHVIRYSKLDLPEALVAWNPIAPVSLKLAQVFLTPAALRAVELAAYARFDRWAARRLRHTPAKVFVGYETNALESFRVAKSRGMVTVLDAASIHHRAQDRLHGFVESKHLHQEICRIKDREIELADFVLTLSEIARDSYLEAGVAANKLRVIPLGADLELFSPGTANVLTTPSFRFIFVGSQIYRKGVDLLVKAFRAVQKLHPQAELVMAGGGGDATELIQVNRGNGIHLLGPMSQRDLVTEYRRADCFVLPSRNDSFGMVVAEALACGLPVIVSDMVGAKYAVREGVNGWVVPTGDLDALRSRMEWCAANRDAMREMRTAAVRSAATLGWDVYYQRVGEFYHELCGSRSAN